MTSLTPDITDAERLAVALDVLGRACDVVYLDRAEALPLLDALVLSRRRVAELETTADDALNEAIRSQLERDEAERERDALCETICESLPRYVYDDGTDDASNEVETVEYAGREIKRLHARVAELEARLEMREVQLRSRDRMRETIVAVLTKHGELGESRADDVVASAVEVVVEAWEVTRGRVAELERERDEALAQCRRSHD